MKLKPVKEQKKKKTLTRIYDMFKVMYSVTHSTARFSSISSWSLRTWAALERQRDKNIV